MESQAAGGPGAREALGGAAEQFRLLMDCVTDYALFILDAEGRVAGWNAGAGRAFGYAEHEVLGRDFALFFTPEDREHGVPGRELRAAAARGRAEDDRWLVRKDGSRFWVAGTLTALRDGAGNLRGFAKVARDRTAQRREQEALRQTNERLHFLYEVATALVHNGKPETYIDQAYRKLAAQLDLEIYFNYLLEADDRTLRLAHHGGISEETARRLARLEVGQAVCGRVALDGRSVALADVQHSDDPRAGHVRALGVTAYACLPLLAHGRVIGTLSFGTRKRASFDAEELLLMQSVCDHVAIALERARLTAELEQRAADLAETDRRKDDFLAVLAHELRNPLAPIRNAVQLLEVLRPEDAQRQWSRELIARQVGHLTRLVDDLLDVSRVTRGKVRLKKEVLDAATVVTRAVEAARPLVEARGHELTVTLPPRPVRLEADPTRLAQVLTNLLANAAKYMNEGGRIWLSASQEGDEVVFRVRDRGIGIPPAMLPRVFDLFTQVDRNLDHADGGLGIGLALVRSLVALHGGGVEAHSDGPGQGSEFIVRLPALPAAAAVGAGPAGDHPPPRVPPRRVLVVDDNADSAESLALLMRLGGHAVETAADGPAALEAAGRFRPNVVLLDIGLPRMDGYEVARRLRQGLPGDGLHIIALTGYGQEEDRRRSREAGIDQHLVKPVEPAALQDLLARRPADG